MEEEEKHNSPETTPTLKSKKKSHNICSLLSIRKKKVGCLPSSSEASQEGSPGPSSAGNSPLRKTAFSPPRLTKRSSSEEHPVPEADGLKRSDAVAKSCSSTNVALCCAITESSHTPLHFQSDFRLRCNNNLSASINRKSLLIRMNGHSEDLGEKLPPSGVENKLKKPASETNIVATTKKSESSIIKKSFFGKKKSHKRSFSLGKPNPSEDVKTLDTSSVECSHSASEISPQSSPSPVEANHTRLRRRLLLSQRRSVDNIVASSSGRLSLTSRPVLI